MKANNATTWIPRAQRFPIHAPLRYCIRGEKQWREGILENISITGLLFKGAFLVERNTSIELNIVLPARPANAQGARIVCQGTILRSWTCSGVPPMAMMAAAITHTRLVRP
ncbi:MAG: hypothetical protein P4K86_09550 [Terracidiphilus sp.]|nr:hypothetical protein [Terracidiphilus sp.]